MANIKSAKKRAEIAERNRQRNVQVRSTMRTAIKKVQAQVAESAGADDVKKSLSEVYGLIDKAVTKGVLKKNTASRYKSRLTRLANKQSA